MALQRRVDEASISRGEDDYVTELSNSMQREVQPMHTQQPTLLTKVYDDMGGDNQEGPPTSIRQLQSSLNR